MNESEPLRIFLFGQFRLTRKGTPLRLSFRKAEALFAYLVLAPEAHPREKLAALFWGDSTDAQARASLRNALAVIRRALGKEVLVTETDTIRLNPDFPLWVDAREFSDFKFQISDLAAGFHSEIQNLKSKIDLYRGDLLADMYYDWVMPLREEYRALYLDALLQLAQNFRAVSEYARAVQTAQRVLQTDAANEPAYQHLIFCHAAMGNRASALETFREFERILQNEVGVQPAAETLALVEWVKQTNTAGSSLAARITNLPIPLTSFIGRSREVESIRQLLAHSRLVTLVGAGGSGKTRLAIRVATDLIQQFREGVWWVDLAALNDPTLVPHAIARAVGIRETTTQSLRESVADYLQQQQTLVVLDNCEHLIGGCAEISHHLLTRCPQLKILATSRETLSISGETVWHVPTLAVPDPTRISVTDLLLTYESVALFCERAAQTQVNFALTAKNAQAIVEICARLDGIPLALELAAARLNLLTPVEIAARLSARFDMLTTGSRAALPRQQTLRALIEWSYDLLNERERIVFRRLSVFAGGFDLRAAEEICASDEISRADVLHLVSQLVNKSLLVAQAHTDSSRYTFLETIAAFAREHLQAAGEVEMVGRKHATYFLELAEDAYWQDRNGARQRLWLNKHLVEFHNFRVAFHWMLGHEPEWSLRLVATVAGLWLAKHDYTELYEWLTRALHRAAQDESLPKGAAYAHARTILGLYKALRGDVEDGIQVIQESIALVRAVGGQRLLADTLFIYGDISRAGSHFDQAIVAFQESAAICGELNEKAGRAHALADLALVVAERGDFDSKQKELQEAIELYHEVNDGLGLAIVEIYLIWADVVRGNVTNANARVEACLAVFQELGDKHFDISLRSDWALLLDQMGNHAESLPHHQAVISEWRKSGNLGAVARQLESIAFILHTTHQAAGVTERTRAQTQAARLLGAAEALREKSSAMTPMERTEYDGAVSALRAQLDPVILEGAWREGRALSLDQAIAEAKAVALVP